MGIYTKAFLKAFKPKPIITISEWADKNRVLGSDTSSTPGRWRTEKTPYLREPMDICGQRDYKHVVLMFGSQLGKALACDTPIATTKGWKTQGTLSVGDYVFGMDGKPAKVIALSEVWRNRPCYKITFSDGSKIIADENHEWYVESDKRLHGYPHSRQFGTWGITDTKNIFNNFNYEVGSGDKKRVRNNFAIPVNCPLELPDTQLPIDPYVLGAWLGDGNSHSAQLTVHIDDVPNMKKQLKLADHNFKTAKGGGSTITIKIDPKDYSHCIRGHNKDLVGRSKNGGCAECARVIARNAGRLSRNQNARLDLRPCVVKGSSFHSVLSENNLLKNKHIPVAYLRSSFKQRLSLLQGLMDTDGTSDKRGRCEFTTTSNKIKTGFGELLSTLGVKYTVSSCIPEITYKGEKVKGKRAYSFSFTTYSELPIFRLERKLERLSSFFDKVRSTETLRRRIVDVKRVHSVPVRCIQVDNSDHLYLAGLSMIPTHNSELINNVSGFYIDQEPAPQMIVQPTLEAAEDYSKIRIGPMIKACPALSEKIQETTSNASKGRGKKLTSTTLFKAFQSSYIVLSGANSAASLASKPIRILLRDEVDRFTDSIPGEGSPLDISEQRTRTFYNKKIVDSSTPLVSGESKIEALFLQSDQRRYYLPCPHCGSYNELMWDLVKWDKDGTDLERSKTARMECPSCNEIMRGAGRIDADWLAKGVWRKTAESDIAGFYINSLCSPFTELSELTLMWLKAVHARDEDKKQAFYNLILGLPYDKSVKQSIDYKEIYKNRREYYPPGMPNEMLMLTCGVDTQDTYLAAELKGWSHGFESWGIEYRIFMGKPDDPAVWNELDAWLLKSRSREDGVELPVMATMVDSGGHYTKEVYEFTKAREGRRVFSIKGHSRDNSPFIGKPSKVGRMNAHLFNIHVDSGKTKIMQRLQLQEPGAGYMHFPRSDDAGYDEEYFRGLLSEKYVLKRVGGHIKGGFVKVYERNEPLDTSNYALAACELVNPDFDALEKMIEARRSTVSTSTSTQARKRVLSRGVDI